MTTDKVRLLYDRAQETARIVVKSREDLEVPLVSLTIRTSIYCSIVMEGHDALLPSGNESCSY